MDKNIPKIRFKGFSKNWNKHRLEEIFKYEQPTKYIVKDINYNDNFDIPVLTAGQSFILGYTNEKSGIKNININNPIIIFDDFTTSSHYVDFPFKIKSSAIKLLTLKQNNYNFYFMYNRLKNLNYIPQGHERHWISKFSTFNVFIPNKDEQKQIGRFFKKIDNLITINQNKLEYLKKIKKSLLQKMFPKDVEKVPNIRFTKFTDIWKQCKLCEIAKIINGGTPNTTNKEYWGGDIDWYVPAEINNEIYVEGSKRKITKLGLKKSSAKILPAYKTVLFTSRAGIGKMAILRKQGTTNQGFQSIVLNNNTNSYFVYSMGSNIKEKAEKVASGSTFSEISGLALGNLKFMFPNEEEQVKIGAFFEKLDNLISLHQHKLEKLRKIKKSYLKKMFV